MPQLLFLAIVGVLGWAVWKKLMREWARTNATLERTPARRAAEAHGQSTSAPSDLGAGQTPREVTLERDPETGVYRPRKDG